MKNYHFVEHTADIGLYIEGSSLENLFVCAAESLIDLLFGQRPEDFQGSLSEDQSICLEANSSEELLVRWLEEILYYFTVWQLIVVRFAPNAVLDRSLDIDVQFVDYDPKTVEPRYEIKAVTYHNLEVRRTDDHYEATVIFDI